MKTKFFFLIIFFSVTSFSQDIIKKVYTDKSVYTYGETVVITIRAINTTESQDTICFPDGCQAYPFVDNIDYRATFGMGCWLALMPRIIPPQDSIEWIYEYPHPSIQNILLSLGQHNVFGQFPLLYSNPDTLIISNTDTIFFNVEQGTSVTENLETNIGFSLQQNYPNPFNPSTTIQFSLEKYSFVSLKIYNSLGQEIETLLGTEKPVGAYKIEWKPNNLSSGIYYYKLTANENSSIKKLTYAK